MVLYLVKIFIILSIGYTLTATIVEKESGVVVKPLEAWGSLARKQNSVRVLCIGGSNTANGLYVGYLHSFLRSNLSISASFKSSSYALNRGVSGHSALSFIGKMYDFEVRSASTWPNVVMIDTSVNFNNRKIVHNECSMVLETLIKSIEFKYNLHKIEVPDFIFYNMPHFGDMLAASLSLKSKPEREQYIMNYVNTTDSHELLSSQINEFAAHYHFPVISWHVAMLPAAQQYFLSTNTSLSTWPYLSNAVHMSAQGAKWGVDNLLVPFFREVMRPREKEPETNSMSVARLHPPRPTLIEVLSYQGFWKDKSLLSLKEIVHSRRSSSSSSSSNASSVEEWQMMSLHHNEEEGYGSTVKGSVGELRFTVPESCSTELYCRVQISLIHSWNASYVGNTSCVLRRLSSPENEGTILGGEPLFIDGQSEVETHTYSIKSMFPVNVTEGLHSVRCTALVEDRLSCIHALDVNTIVVM